MKKDANRHPFFVPLGDWKGVCQQCRSAVSICALLEAVEAEKSP